MRQERAERNERRDVAVDDAATHIQKDQEAYGQSEELPDRLSSMRVDFDVFHGIKAQRPPCGYCPSTSSSRD
jgi:hypothetical protein